MTRELKGRHVALIFGSAFAVIIGVNIVLAVQAVRTFPGLEVKNSYIASQTFDEERAAQVALGWTVRADFEDDRLHLTISGLDGPADARMIEVRLGRRTYAGEDRILDLLQEREVFLADLEDLAPGAWTLWVRAEAPDGTPFRQRLNFWVK